MKVVTSTDDYTIYQRRDGRYAVKNKAREAVNGEEKVKILLAHELIAVQLPKEPEPEPEAEAEAEAEGGEEAAEAEAPGEDADDEASSDT